MNGEKTTGLLTALAILENYLRGDAEAFEELVYGSLESETEAAQLVTSLVSLALIGMGAKPGRANRKTLRLLGELRGHALDDINDDG
jgi:hypothetical protein